MPFATSTKRQPGFGLLVVVLLLSVVAVIAGSVALSAQSSMQRGHRDSRTLAAEDTAYSGLQMGLAAASTEGNSWNGNSNTTAMPQRSDLGYRLLVNNNISGTASIQDSDGTEIPVEAMYLKSLAYLDGELQAGMSAIIAQQRGMTFNYPAFGSEDITMVNSLVQAIEANGDPAPGDAPIRINGQGADSISLSGGSFVDGDVKVGPGGDPAVALSAEAGSGFAGSAETAGTALPLPEVPASYMNSAPDVVPVCVPLPVPYPDLGWINITLVIVPAGTYNKIEIAPASIVRLEPELAAMVVVSLEGGSIYCNSLTTSGGEPVKIQTSNVSNTLLHVRDEIDFRAPSTALDSSSATSLQIYQTSDDKTVSLARTSGSLVLAAQGEVTAVDSVISGALYGKSLTLNNTTLTYPKELDGQILNDKIRGNWKLFGTRSLTPSELQANGTP